MCISRVSLLLALIPTMAVAQGHCAVPSTYAEPAITLPSVINPLVSAKQESPARSDAATSLPESADQSDAVRSPELPALRRLRASGSAIEEVGREHGMNIYVAYSPGHFMVFEVTPDQEAILSGLEMQVPLARLLSLSKNRIQELPTAHGLRAFFLRTGERFQVFYATPDEQRVIPGMMWDEAGRNITRQQIASVPGTRPQVQIESGISAGQTANGHGGNDQIEMVKATYAGTYGRAGAPHAWMFIDPQCSFSVRALETLQPFINAGAIQLSVVPLSILDAEDHGLSTAHAIAMVRQSPGRMVSAWQKNELDIDQPAVGDADANARLQRNMATAASLSLRGTPAFIWEGRDGSLGRVDGMPTDISAMIRSIGS